MDINADYETPSVGDATAQFSEATSELVASLEQFAGLLFLSTASGSRYIARRIERSEEILYFDADGMGVCSRSKPITRR